MKNITIKEFFGYSLVTSLLYTFYFVIQGKVVIKNSGKEFRSYQLR